MTTENKHEEIQLLDYRVGQLESAVKDFALIKEKVLGWDARFGNSVYLQCPVHSERMNSLSERMEKAENSIEGCNKFMYKAIGALVVISIIIQLVGPLALDYLKPANPVNKPTQVAPYAIQAF
jgi:hypothetical protein